MNKLFFLALLCIAALCVAQKCTTISQGAVGAQCDFTGRDRINENITYTCLPEAACQNSTLTCVKSVSYNSACSGEGVVPCPHSTGLQCIQDKCTTPLKMYKEPCGHNDECASKMCVGGFCDGQALGQNCTITSECILYRPSNVYLYCHPFDKNCTAFAEVGNVCSNTRGIMCNHYTSSCVNETCHAYAKVGELCSASGDANPLHPSCDMFAQLTCAPDTKRCIAPRSRTNGEACWTGNDCVLGSACNGTVCKPNAEVTCDDTNAGSRCKTGKTGYCACKADHKEGVCAESTEYCVAEGEAYGKCLLDKCTGGSFAFAPNGCVATHCAAQRNALYCCTHKLTGYTPFNEFDAAVCTAPTPTPRPSPGQTVPSSATVTMINVFTIFVVIASLLL